MTAKGIREDQKNWLFSVGFASGHASAFHSDERFLNQLQSEDGFSPTRLYDLLHTLNLSSLKGENTNPDCMSVGICLYEYSQD